jgi:mannose-6-phosphate isomerase-like protein (cupin superfamily)
MMPTHLPNAAHQRAEEYEFFTPERCFILEIWNSEHDHEVSIARARVKPGVTTALHALAVDERYIIERGRGRVEVQGMEPAHVGPGDAVLIPRGAAQRICNTGPDDLVFLCICTPRFQPEHYQALEHENP